MNACTPACHHHQPHDPACHTRTSPRPRRTPPLHNGAAPVRCPARATGWARPCGRRPSHREGLLGPTAAFAPALVDSIRPASTNPDGDPTVKSAHHTHPTNSPPSSAGGSFARPKRKAGRLPVGRSNPPPPHRPAPKGRPRRRSSHTWAVRERASWNANGGRSNPISNCHATLAVLSSFHLLLVLEVQERIRYPQCARCISRKPTR